jgi:hypothetical protein
LQLFEWISQINRINRFLSEKWPWQNYLSEFTFSLISADNNKTASPELAALLCLVSFALESYARRHPLVLHKERIRALGDVGNTCSMPSPLTAETNKMASPGGPTRRQGSLADAGIPEQDDFAVRPRPMHLTL